MNISENLLPFFLYHDMYTLCSAKTEEVMPKTSYAHVNHKRRR